MKFKSLREYLLYMMQNKQLPTGPKDNFSMSESVSRKIIRVNKNKKQK